MRASLAQLAAARAGLAAADRGAVAGIAVQGRRVPAYSCAMGTCSHCGFYKRKILKSSHCKLLSIGLSVNKSMVVTGLGEATSEARKLKVKIGWRLLAVDNRRVESKSAANKLLYKGSTMLFERRAPRKTTALDFANCPLGQDGEMQFREYRQTLQQRARPSYSKDGEMLTSRTVKSLVSDSEPRGNWKKRAWGICSRFFGHAFVAHYQADAFDAMIDNLPLGGILILADYSMNYSHTHQDGDQQEWWAAWQSTLLPLVVYYRNNDGKVWAESRVYISADLEVSLCISARE